MADAWVALSRDRAWEGGPGEIGTLVPGYWALQQTFTLAADGGGYWPGLIVPVVIVIVGLLTAAVVLLVTREPRGAAPEPSGSVLPRPAAPEPSVSDRPNAAAEPKTEKTPEGPGEDE